jgi:hypothetical protein
MGCCDHHWIVEHEGALEAPQAATCPGSFTPFDGPSLGGNVVGPEEDRWVLNVKMGALVESAPIVYACGIIDEYGSILKAVDVDQLAVAAITYVSKGALPNSLGPFKIPPELHVGGETARGV